MRHIRFALVCAVVLQWFGAEAATLRVPADFTTIQAAVDAARPGDTIVVSAGVYNEKVVIARPEIRLLSGPGGSNVTNNNANNTIVQNVLYSGHWGICIGPEGLNSGNAVARNYVGESRPRRDRHSRPFGR